MSIPVFLAQAEGVVKDRHEPRQLFSKDPTSNLSRLSAEIPDDDLKAIAIAAFYAKSNPLTTHTKDLPADFDGLNRHAVLHGTHANYGTQINSLRAVSLLSLASYLVSAEDKQLPHSGESCTAPHCA